MVALTSDRSPRPREGQLSRRVDQSSRLDGLVPIFSHFCFKRSLTFSPATVGAPLAAAASAARLASVLVSTEGPPESQPVVTTAATRRSFSTRSLIRWSFPPGDPAA